MTELRREAWVQLAAIALTVVLLDQATKVLVVQSLGSQSGRHERPLLGSWVSLEYVQNRGAVFGLFQRNSVVVTLLILIGIAVLAAALLRVAQPSWPFIAGAGLVSGGAIGNVIDRIRLGYVTDFIAVGAWWRFNVADSAVTGGALTLIWLTTRAQDDRREDQRTMEERT